MEKNKLKWMIWGALPFQETSMLGNVGLGSGLNVFVGRFFLYISSCESGTGQTLHHQGQIICLSGLSLGRFPAGLPPASMAAALGKAVHHER